VNLRLGTKDLQCRRVIDFYLAKTLEKKAFLKVLLYTMQSLVSIFKTAKPSSLGLDHSRKCLLEKVKKSAILKLIDLIATFAHI
jgi:hypothetical protein